MNLAGEHIQIDTVMVLATRNQGKISEFESILGGFDVRIKSLGDFPSIPAVEEDGATFKDNSLKKARFTAKTLGLPALADDSGLMVKAMGGLPGVCSARYAGEHATDEKNNLLLLEAMEGVENRGATFKCTIAIALPDGAALTYEGTSDGLITHELIGKGGFGYDPLFYYPPLEKTFAQLTTEEKNRVSHRGRAMAELKKDFGKVLQWLRQRL